MSNANTAVKLNTAQIIRESDLLAVLTLREQQKKLAAELKKVKDALEKNEGVLISALKAGAVAEGALSASVDVKIGAVRPSWKDEYIGHMVTNHGLTEAGAEAEVRERTDPSMSEVLVIATR